MSLPPALLARLAQRGLVQKQQKQKDTHEANNTKQAENEEVIAEDYDEMDGEGPEVYPSQYDHSPQRKRPVEENFWIERMKARMGDSTSIGGYKACPNKYNIWHKCSVYCVTRWAEGHPEPSREYMRRFKRLLRKYPLPKGWTEMYDPGCGCYYFYSLTENLVSWLPPTHPNSQVSKSAAVLRRQLEDEAAGGTVANSEGEEEEEEDEETAADRHQREVDEIISASISARDQRGGSENIENDLPHKQRSRERVTSRQRDRERSERERGRERNRDRNRERGGYGGSSHNYGREDSDILDPMDPSAYSDTPRGKWSSGLNTANEERPQKSSGGDNNNGRERRNRDRRDERSDEDDDDYH